MEKSTVLKSFNDLRKHSLVVISIPTTTGWILSSPLWKSTSWFRWPLVRRERVNIIWKLLYKECQSFSEIFNKQVFFHFRCYDIDVASDAKSWLIGKDPDAGKNWGQEEMGATEDEMVGWHHWPNGHESEQTPGDSERQRSLACCSPWGHKELHTTERLKTNIDVFWWRVFLKVDYPYFKPCEDSNVHTKVYISVQRVYIAWSHLTPTSSLHCILFSVLSHGCCLASAFAIGSSIKCILSHDFLQKQKPT